MSSSAVTEDLTLPSLMSEALAAALAPGDCGAPEPTLSADTTSMSPFGLMISGPFSPTRYGVPPSTSPPPAFAVNGFNCPVAEFGFTLSATPALSTGLFATSLPVTALITSLVTRCGAAL